MDKLRILCAIALALCYIGACGVPVDSRELPDSVVTDDNVYRYMFSDMQKAEAVMAALRQKKKLPEWELDYTEGDLYYNTGRCYRALKFYTRVLESDKAKKDDSLYMDILHRMISCYDITHNDSRKAEYMDRLLHKAEECDNKAMQAVALFNIGKSRYEHGDREAGYSLMEKAARMMEETDYKNKYDNLRYHYNTLLTYYERDLRGEDALRTLNALEKVATAFTGHESAAIDGLDEKERKAFLGHRTVVLNMLGRTAEADACYAIFASLGRPDDRDQYIVMPYLFDRHMYDEIFRINHLREQSLREQGDTVNYHMTTIRKMLGRAYFETGDYKAAAINFEMLAALRDSIKDREQRSAVLELAEVYESGEKDKVILAQRMHKRILYGAVTVSAVIILLVVGYNRKIRRRNISLVRAVRESVSVSSELARKTEECLRLRKLPEPTDDKEGAREREQIERVIHEIDSRRLYLRPGLVQKDVLEFARAIPAYQFGAVFRKHSGMYFSEYINRKRMEHAVRLLTEHPEYTVDSVAGMCGIKSKQHFHRQFQEFTGLTPATFRKSGNQPIDGKPVAEQD